MTTVAATSTVAALLVKVADALNEQIDTLDLYSVVAPVVIGGYADLDSSELGFVPGGSFGRHDYGTYDAVPAIGVQATVDMFMGLLKDMSIVRGIFKYSRPVGRHIINTSPIDLAHRLHRMGMQLTEAGYPTDTWRITAGGHSCDVLTGFTDLNDSRLLYVVSQLELIKNVGALGPHGVDVIASHALATFDAGLTEPEHGSYVSWITHPR